MTLDNLMKALVLNDKELLNRVNSSGGGGGMLSNEQIETIANLVANKVAKKLDDQGTTILPSAPYNNPVIYGYKKTIAEPDPDLRIEYLDDCLGFKPAHMDFETDTFDYGDWKDAFFMQIKPVMLYYDGTVAYELDPNDYTKKIDGTLSDIDNIDFPGNAMVGIPTVWFKRETIGGITYVRVANYQVDTSWKAYAHTGEKGHILKYCYIPIYNGSLDTRNSSEYKLRSLSGVVPAITSYSQSVSYAYYNNKNEVYTDSGEVRMWNIETRADIQMLIDLLTLISKSSDSQAKFGRGNCNNSANAYIASGSMNDKGLFYGTNTGVDGVKVFGIENFWGNRSSFIVGSAKMNNNIFTKMTYGTQDGTKVVGYGLATGNSGTFAWKQSRYTSSNNSYTMYIKETYTDDHGIQAINVTSDNLGSAHQYECCGTYQYQQGYYSNNSWGVETHGGSNNYGDYCGSAMHEYKWTSTTTNVSQVGASLSCKPDIYVNRV